MTRDALIDLIARMEPTRDADDAVSTVNRLIAEARECLKNPTDSGMSAEDEEALRSAARDEWQREGAIEIDEGAIVSAGDDPGAYVAVAIAAQHHA